MTPYRLCQILYTVDRTLENYQAGKGFPKERSTMSGDEWAEIRRRNFATWAVENPRFAELTAEGRLMLAALTVQLRKQHPRWQPAEPHGESVPPHGPRMFPTPPINKVD